MTLVTILGKNNFTDLSYFRTRGHKIVNLVNGESVQFELSEIASGIDSDPVRSVHGKILRKGKGEHWIVETDTLRAAFPPTDLRRVPSGSETPGLDFSICGELKGAVFQIDLRGLRMEEALQRLEKQIDAALIQGLSSFGVIHGKGQGILQKGIHQYLARQAAVTNFHFAAPEDGGSGKTLVSLG